MAKQRFVSLDLQSSQECEGVFGKTRLTEPGPRPEVYSIIGAGKSITGAFFGEGVTVVGLKRDSDLIELDPRKGQIEISGGVTIAQAQNYLIPKGYMLTGVPSYPGVSIGGCIAGNVHGQNHFREGCFSENLIQFVLAHPDHGLVSVGRENYPELFFLTVGGFGLTGLIVSATLRVEPIINQQLDVSFDRFSSIQEGYDKLASKRNSARYFHSWVDLTSASSKEGKGFFYKADFASKSEGSFQAVSCSANKKNHLRYKIPVFSKLTVSAINKIYYQKNKKFPKTTQSLVDFLFPSAGRLWYFSMFGKKGIIEHQVLIPDEFVTKYLKRLMDVLRTKRPFISLCHIKYFSGKRQFLNFNGSGLCLAMHFSAGSTELETLELIDKLNCEFNCITNILKDSRVPRWAIKEQYTEYDQFVSGLQKFDPRRCFRNTLSQRLIDVG